MRRFLVSILIALVISPSLAQPSQRRHTSRQRVASDDSRSLPRSTPEREGISSAAILDFVDTADLQIDTMNSFVLIRHGSVVAEGWWNPYDAETPHILYSLSKSFTSTAVGLAIAEGKMSLDDEVLKFFPDDAPAEPSPNLKAMRVRDLLRMATGNQTEAPILTQNEPWTRTFLAHPVPFKPGTHFLYNSPGTYMLSAIVQKVTGMTVLDYLKPRLFAPLGIDNPSWVTSPQGISAGAYGLSLRTEDIARFGQLYLQKGKWHGKQLVPAEWIAEATARQTANGSSPNSDWDQGYGYQFWRSRHNTYRGDGAFGQYCMVLPEFDAVVVITSGVRDMQSVMNLVWSKLLPAMKPDHLPENTVARRKLEARLAGLAVKLPSGQPTMALAATVSGEWFEFPENDRGIQAVSFDFNSSPIVFSVRMAGGEIRTPVGIGSWHKGPNGFANGLDKFLNVAEHPLVAASGAWAANDVFKVKLVLYQTPYYSTLTFKFDGNRLSFEAMHNVSFSSTKLPQLVGRAHGGL
ncbi:MAG TPA: serine hydrolase [Pyrinomonadaceae bacterium]|jgi:CubicO group peptidase (beta-lactamase class C family)|nr:serine hydrolase [Pyrinomonadaceae bacterium]